MIASDTHTCHSQDLIPNSLYPKPRLSTPVLHLYRKAAELNMVIKQIQGEDQVGNARYLYIHTSTEFRLMVDVVVVLEVQPFFTYIQTPKLQENKEAYCIRSKLGFWIH